MKHHKVVGVWRHRPDTLPIEDGPSTGTKKKKRPFAVKHLWDRMKQNRKELLEAGEKLIRDGIPTKLERGPYWVSADCHFAEWRVDSIIKASEKMDGLIAEILEKMPEAEGPPLAETH